MNILIKTIGAVLLTGSLLLATKPRSIESSLVEHYSPTEVMIKATGIGIGKNNTRGADRDLRKSALYYVLHQGTDAMLSNKDAKRKFGMIEKDFYKDIERFITWEGSKVIKQVRVNYEGEKSLKRTKMIRLDIKKIREELESKNVIASKEKLADAQGMPMIMVIPEAPSTTTPLEVLDRNPLAKQAAAAIESYLTARQYEVIVPRASEQITEMTKLQQEIHNGQVDQSYQLALAIGSDIYVTYAGEVKDSKASVSVKAYETTTGRLLGTETGYSRRRPGAPDQVVTEEAINDAFAKVLQRLTNYWTKDLKQGLQYKLVLQFNGDWNADTREKLQEKIEDLIDDGFDKSKENIATSKTMDYLLWAHRDEYSKGSRIYRYLRKGIKGLATLRKVSINRKLIILSVED